MGNPDKIVAVGLGEVLYDHDVVTDEYTFGGAPANFADHFLKCSRLISGPDAAEVHVVSAVGDDERGRAVSAGPMLSASVRWRSAARRRTLPSSGFSTG